MSHQSTTAPSVGALEAVNETRPGGRPPHASAGAASGQASELLAELDAELHDEYRGALYVTPDLHDVDALEHVGLVGACATRPAALLALARDVSRGGSAIVLVGVQDPGELAAMITAEAHGADVREVGLPPGTRSVAGMLGYLAGSATRYTDAEAEAKRETWLAWATGARPVAVRESAVPRPEADGDDEGEDGPSALVERWGPVRSLFDRPPPARQLLRLPTYSGKPALLRAGDPFLRRGRVGSLVSGGGVGKTHALLNLAVAVATGGAWFGHYPVDDSDGRVLLLLAEEDAEESHRRLYYACEGLSDDARRSVQDRVTLAPMMGRPCGMLYQPKRGRFGETNAYLDLCRLLRRDAGPDGWALLVLDPLSRVAGVSTDLDNDAATAVVGMAEQLTEAAGNPTVLLSVHANKASRREGERVESRGASGLTDGVRWEANLRRDKGKLWFHVAKSNYGLPMDEPGLELVRGEHGMLRAVVPTGPAVDPVAEHAARLFAAADARRAAVVATVAAMGGVAPSARSIVERTTGKGTALFAAIKEAVAAGLLLPQGSGYRLPPVSAAGADFCAPPPHPPSEREAGSTPLPLLPLGEQGSEGKQQEAGSGSPIQMDDDGLPEQPKRRRRSRAEMNLHDTIGGLGWDTPGSQGILVEILEHVATAVATSGNTQPKWSADMKALLADSETGIRRTIALVDVCGRAFTDGQKAAKAMRNLAAEIRERVASLAGGVA